MAALYPSSRAGARRLKSRQRSQNLFQGLHIWRSRSRVHWIESPGVSPRVGCAFSKVCWTCSLPEVEVQPPPALSGKIFETPHRYRCVVTRYLSTSDVFLIIKFRNELIVNQSKLVIPHEANHFLEAPLLRNMWAVHDSMCASRRQYATIALHEQHCYYRAPTF